MRFPTVQSVALIAAILATEGVVTATNCVRGRYYCGATLNDLGGYRERIDAAMPPCAPVNSYLYSLFECLSNTGEIRFLQICCSKCVAGGFGSSDFCQPVTPPCTTTKLPCTSTTTSGSTFSTSITSSTSGTLTSSSTSGIPKTSSTSTSSSTLKTRTIIASTAA